MKTKSLLIAALLMARVSLAQDASDPTSTPTHLEPVRNTIWIPLASLVVPGLGQYIEGDVSSGLGFSGMWLGGQYLGWLYYREVDDFKKSPAYNSMTKEEKENYETHEDGPRKLQLGSQISFAAGSFSTYHNYHARIQAHKQRGDYAFITAEDSIPDILTAPFRFSFLAHPRTFIPLAIVASLYVIQTNSENKTMQKDAFTASDMAFAGSFSYLAGTHEEALFRGFILPALTDSFGSGFWANSVTALGFAAAHLGSNPTPLPQLILGWHLGNVTMKNGYSIQESAFIHTWWDVVAFSIAYQYKNKNPEAKVNPVLWLPPFEYAF